MKERLCDRGNPLVHDGILEDCGQDHSSSSGTLSFQPLRSQGPIPTAHVMPSPSSSKLSVPSAPTSPWSSCQLPSPLDSPLDMKDPRPVRRWSSLTRLTGQEKSTPPGRPSYRMDPHGSLDRGVLYGYRQDPLYSDGFLSESLHKLSTNSDFTKYDLGSSNTLGKTDSSCSSPLKPSTLDLTYSALPESKTPTIGLAGPGQRGPTLRHQTVGGSPIQPAVRTQMWLSEQMEYRPGPEGCGSWQQEQQQRERLRQEAELPQMLGGTSLPVNTLVKIKEGLLRQRELEIDRQKQQILQLHARIRENELRAQQVLQNQRGRYDDSYLLKAKDSPYDSPVSSQSPKSQLPERVSPLCRENGELGCKLAAAEQEVIHLSEFLKQNTQKYTEDIKKLEEKMKTRDRYISSLKKKCQREQEQNQEKQQRIETLEKYLADLPSLDEVQTQAQQLQEVQGNKQTLEDTVAKQEKTLEENQALLQEKDALIETQSKREKELVAAVQSLQEKVETCLEDGVRLPMLDLKQLERENTRLLEQQSQNSLLIDDQKQQIDKLSLEMSALEKKLQRERGITQELRKQLLEREEELETLSKTLQQNQRRPDEETLNVTPGPLLKEMSLCLLDLKGLCSVLTQRAQGKEPNLALLLGIKSMSCSAEDIEKPLMEDGLQAKLVEVCQLRKDIDELRTLISDRYAQDMGENCVTQ
ncbi:centrosomal protein of 85 kDa-like isoform X4 [Sinocyclocheilus grahami]|uniref:centrosomal protein of 85 kDa-like isoform X4 n=1 Tax=Sinocyclocheilus grahami TaxID=75366 RepID=UPI0007ACB7FD|nr:PREDICTED: centrosomal protein of 85 kDa-like isoform X4 [Sinocyclocheilus grahami]XP_016151277.1 PREDICTED: centrosomal protein of 85 kDa-like isoform X4 [Sinocyclocheilus grahami]